MCSCSGSRARSGSHRKGDVSNGEQWQSQWSETLEMNMLLLFWKRCPVFYLAVAVLGEFWDLSHFEKLRSPLLLSLGGIAASESVLFTQYFSKEDCVWSVWKHFRYSRWFCSLVAISCFLHFSLHQSHTSHLSYKYRISTKDAWTFPWWCLITTAPSGLACKLQHFQRFLTSFVHSSYRNVFHL